MTTYTVFNPSPLHDAAARGDISRFMDLLSAGEDPNGLNEFGQTTLHLAVMNRKLEMLSAIIPHTNVLLKNRKGTNALHQACSSGVAEACDILVAAGIPIDDKDDSGRTPFAVSMMAGHGALGMHLMALGADLSKLGGAELLDVSFRLPEQAGLDMFEAALKKGADIHAENSNRMNALLQAVYLQRHDFLVRILDLGGDPLQVTSYDRHEELPKESALSFAEATDEEGALTIIRSHLARKEAEAALKSINLLAP